jgi:hypothetical protein
MRLPPGNIDLSRTGIYENIDWRYQEPYILEDLYEYFASTYDEHYSSGDIQASEFISSSGRGEGFFIGNIIKYADRYGKKGGHNKKDLLKIAHYIVMAIWEHENKYGE